MWFEEEFKDERLRRRVRWINECREVRHERKFECRCRGIHIYIHVKSRPGADVVPPKS
ncbi:hypothetical protein J6TS1_33370 [Siminovitchia terrae]|uniref:Uncharacterized protein n=1 Tax=Siminovitchia terrae TaxID=1914933 RepID=A0ABQ4L0I1_SIMTE|nr:hypothetical protein J6TS1_33370 [Siminovitchia terrae]